MNEVTKHFRPTMELSYYIYPSSHPDYDPKNDNEAVWTWDWFQRKAISLGYSQFEGIENKETDTQACVCVKGDIVYLVFRGSSTINDWWTNLNIDFMPCAFGQVHEGFMLDARSVYLRVIRLLADHIENGKRLIITGHSQGAGVACCIAMLLLVAAITPYAVIHFGGPRVVDTAAAQNLDHEFPEMFHRVVNHNEIVTRIAPRALGYKHFGNFHYFTHDGEYTNHIKEWELEKDRNKGQFNYGGKYFFYFANNHDPINYLRLVESL